jgi:hypothetical protein
MEKQKLKWSGPIWKDPIGWARYIGNSKKRVYLWCLIHLLFVSYGFWEIYNRLVRMNIDSYRLISTLRFGAIPIFYIGVFFPVLYIYVIYRLLKIIDQKNTL